MGKMGLGPPRRMGDWIVEGREWSGGGLIQSSRAFRSNAMSHAVVRVRLVCTLRGAGTKGLSDVESGGVGANAVVCVGVGGGL